MSEVNFNLMKARASILEAVEVLKAAENEVENPTVVEIAESQLQVIAEGLLDLEGMPDPISTDSRAVFRRLVDRVEFNNPGSHYWIMRAALRDEMRTLSEEIQAQGAAK